MAKITKTIGKLPVFKNAWVEGTAYSMLNQVTHLGSTFQSKIDNNTSVPGEVVNNELVISPNWAVISNGTAAYLAGSRLSDVEEKNAQLEQKTSYKGVVSYPQSDKGSVLQCYLYVPNVDKRMGLSVIMYDANNKRIQLQTWNKTDNVFSTNFFVPSETKPTGIKRYTLDNGVEAIDIVLNWDNLTNYTNSATEYELLTAMYYGDEYMHLFGKTAKEYNVANSVVLNGDYTIDYLSSTNKIVINITSQIVIQCKEFYSVITPQIIELGSKEHAYVDIAAISKYQGVVSVNKIVHDGPTLPVNVSDSGIYGKKRFFIFGRGVGLYLSYDNIGFVKPILPKEIKYTTITATRNANDFNSIRELMDTLSPDYYNRYIVKIPIGRWFECDLIGKKYVKLVGEDMHNTVLYCDGLSDKAAPEYYSFAPYKGMPLSEIPNIWKHVFNSRFDIECESLTIEANDAKYCIHLDANADNENTSFNNCRVVFKSNLNYCVGIGLHGTKWSQKIKFTGCEFVRNGGIAIFCHNWHNQDCPCFLTVQNSKFTGCSFITIDELGSEQNDIFELIGCYSDVVNPSVTYMVDNNADNKTFWINPETGLNESDPSKVPYCIKCNFINTNVSKATFFNFPNFVGNPRPEALKYTFSQITSFT